MLVTPNKVKFRFVLVSGRPGGGREFGDATDWKIAQPGQD
jgi:hypothetical protein